MNFQQLRFLVAVHEHGLNMTGADRHLRTSQPGISKQLKQLEDELGLHLFEEFELIEMRYQQALALMNLEDLFAEGQLDCM